MKKTATFTRKPKPTATFTRKATPAPRKVDIRTIASRSSKRA